MALAGEGRPQRIGRPSFCDRAARHPAWKNPLWRGSVAWPVVGVVKGWTRLARWALLRGSGGPAALVIGLSAPPYRRGFSLFTGRRTTVYWPVMAIAFNTSPAANTAPSTNPNKRAIRFSSIG